MSEIKKFLSNFIITLLNFIGRVVGGNEAVLGQFPYHALLSLIDKNNKRFTCGGSLITYKTILTVNYFQNFQLQKYF